MRPVQVVSLAGALKAGIAIGPHALVADEPVESGGTDAGPNPYEYLGAALGTCTVLTLKLYAARKVWPLDAVSTEVTGEQVGEVYRLMRKISLEGPLEAKVSWPGFAFP